MSSKWVCATLVRAFPGHFPGISLIFCSWNFNRYVLWYINMYVYIYDNIYVHHLYAMYICTVHVQYIIGILSELVYFMLKIRLF